jgi:hypothetical protein
MIDDVRLKLVPGGRGHWPVELCEALHIVEDNLRSLVAGPVPGCNQKIDTGVLSESQISRT